MRRYTSIGFVNSKKVKSNFKMKQKSKKTFIHDALRNKGFTLVEIAIVLVIIGILVSLGAALIGPLTKRAKYTETKDIVNAAVESVISYGASNKKLPLQGDFTPDDTIDEFVEIVRNPRDAWTKTLYYIVDSDLTSTPIAGTDPLCGRTATKLTICRDTACTAATNITNVAFVVISGADNYNVQTGIITAAPCPAGTCVRAYEIDTPDIDDCTNSTNCPNYPAGETISRPEPYDDIVKWVNLNELKVRAGCVGGQLKIITNELPSVYRCSSYNASIYADGGVTFADGGDSDTLPDYEWCTTTTAPGGLSYNCNGILSASASCTLAAGTWQQCTSPAISGIPNTPGVFNITFFARDNNDPKNIAQKTFVLAINVENTGFRVQNNTGSEYDFIVDGFCRNNVGNEEITQPINNYLLNPGETIGRYAFTGVCNTFQQQITYAQAVNADVNCNHEVNFTLTDASDR